MGEVSWEQFALLAAEVAKEKIAINTDLIKGMSAHEMTWRAKRPINPTLVSERIQQLPTLEDAIGRYVKDLQIPIEFKQEIL
jgi:dTDP-4-dehydrorhamnose reductase